MRILVCHPGPHFSVQDVYTGWVEGLRRHGVQVIEFNLSDRLSFYESAAFQVQPNMFRRAVTVEKAIELAVNGLYAALYKTRPDVMLGISGFFLTPDLLELVRSSRTRVVLAHTESPYEDGRQLALAPHADINLINDPTNLKQFKTLAPSYYTHHCYREAAHRPGPAVDKLISDLAFVGTGYPSRVEFFEQMRLEGLDVLLAGHWQGLGEESSLRKYVAHDDDECLDNDQTIEVYRSTSVGINLYRREGLNGEAPEGWSMGPREVEMAACGTFFLRDPRPEGDKLLSMLPTFADADEASEQLHYWLARPEGRREIALKARAAVADRTFANQAAQLLRLLDRQPVTA